MRCPHCGEAVQAAAIYCPKCGERLPKEPEPEAEVPSLAAPLARRDVPEETLWNGCYSPKAMLPTWVVVDLTAVAMLVGGVLLNQTAWSFVAALALMMGVIFVWLYRRLAVRYRLTNQRLFHERGILWRITNRIELIAIDDLSFEQGPLERIMNVGDIHVFAHDSTNPMLTLHGIDDVTKVFALIDQGRRAEKLRRGISIDEAHFRHAPGETSES